MGSSYGKTASRGERERGEEGRGPCFALLNPSPLVSHLRECFSGLSGDALSSSFPPSHPPLFAVAVASVSLSGETQFTPLKSIVLRGALQRGKKVVGREREKKGRRRERTGERKQPVSGAESQDCRGRGKTIHQQRTFLSRFARAISVSSRDRTASFACPSSLFLIPFFLRRALPDDNFKNLL